MVIIWLMMVNNKLVGGLNLPLWKILVKWDDYSQWLYGKVKNVPNHQPDEITGLELGL